MKNPFSSPAVSSITGTLLLVAALTTGFIGISKSVNAENWHEQNSQREQAEQFLPLYQQECSACHIAYPSTMLPARSWESLMSHLDDHFGDDASPDQATTATIKTWLVANAATGNGRFVRRLDESAVPERITELPYFQRKHDEIPRRLVTGNPQVGSFSQCNQCHQQAARGRFNEHDVVIPGFGRWDD